MSDQGYWRSSMRWCAQTRTSFISMRLAERSKVPRETLRLLPRTVIPSAAEGSPLQAGKRWVFDDETREVLSLPPRTPVVISGVQERFLGFALFRLWPTPCPSGIPLPWEVGEKKCNNAHLMEMLIKSLSDLISVSIIAAAYK